MASESNSSDDLQDQISRPAIGLPGSQNETESQNKGPDLVSQLQDITDERDLYEKKLKALVLVMVSMDNEICCLQRKHFFLVEKITSLHAAVKTVLPTLIKLLERCLPAGLWPGGRFMFDELSKALEDLMEA